MLKNPRQRLILRLMFVLALLSATSAYCDSSPDDYVDRYYDGYRAKSEMTIVIEDPFYAGTVTTYAWIDGTADCQGLTCFRLYTSEEGFDAENPTLTLVADMASELRYYIDGITPYELMWKYNQQIGDSYAGSHVMPAGACTITTHKKYELLGYETKLTPNGNSNCLKYKATRTTTTECPGYSTEDAISNFHWVSSDRTWTMSQSADGKNTESETVTVVYSTPQEVDENGAPSDPDSTPPKATAWIPILLGD